MIGMIRGAAAPHGKAMITQDNLLISPQRGAFFLPFSLDP